MDTKFTPGPWELDSSGQRVWNPKIKCGHIAHIYCKDSSSGTKFYRDETAKANARLISAAPELLEACKYAFENLRPKGNVKKDFSGHLAMATLSKAINKAEGR